MHVITLTQALRKLQGLPYVVVITHAGKPPTRYTQLPANWHHDNMSYTPYTGNAGDAMPLDRRDRIAAMQAKAYANDPRR